MKEQIEQINTSIAAERNRLKEKVSRSFDTITIPTAPTGNRGETIPSVVKTPEICYVLYIIAVIFVFIGISADESKFLYFLLAVPCAIGGYMFSKRHAMASVPPVSLPSVDIDSLKASITAKGIESVKNVTKEWEEFMERTQKRMYVVIDSSPLSESQKDSLSSKIFSYEVIDINLSDLMTMINSATSVHEIQMKLDSFKSKFLNAIDLSADNQIKKYRSLIMAVQIR